MASKTRLDHRADLLESAAERRIQVLMDAIRPPGAPRPLSEQMTNQGALAWWRQNRYTPAGQLAMQGWSAQQVLELDAWLSRNPDPALATPGAPSPVNPVAGPVPGGVSPVGY